jgi:hypothetical protein
MGVIVRDFLAMRIKACTAAYFAVSILLLLGTSVAHASPLSDAGVGATAAGAHAELFDVAQHYMPPQVSGFSGTNDVNGVESDNVDGEMFPAPGALAGGASTTGGLDSNGLARASSTSHTSTTFAVLESSFSRGAASRGTAEFASDDALLKLGAGSRLFGSHIPPSPAGNSSTNGSPGAVGVLTLLSGNALATAEPGRPPLPPYGRRVTWTFRAPTTRPG